MEVDNAPAQQTWAIEDTEHDPGLIYRTTGWKGQARIENVGPEMVWAISRQPARAGVGAEPLVL